MTKKELTKRVMETYNKNNQLSYLTPKMVEEILSVVTDVLIDALVTDGKVTVRDFVNLELLDYDKEYRNVWNPYTQEMMKYKPKKKIHCKFGKKIRNAVNAV